jgi:AcrR family transcriptional regulator
MNTIHAHETKKKIIDVARKIFSENGFEGTSIRELAKQAEVNVAAINYHFGSKEQLFFFIIQDAITNLTLSLKLIYENHLLEKTNAEDFFLEVYRYFHKNSSDIVSTMKVLMSVPMTQKTEMRHIKEIEKGPPGTEYFERVLIKNSPKEISAENLHWATTAIFSHITHKTIIMHTCISEEDKENPDYFCSDLDFENGVRKLIQSIFLFLKQ